MTKDEIGIETEMAGLLDELAGELNGIAEQLRRKPFAAVQSQLLIVWFQLQFILDAGDAIKAGRLDKARASLLQVNDGTAELWRQGTEEMKQWRQQHEQGATGEVASQLLGTIKGDSYEG